MESHDIFGSQKFIDSLKNQQILSKTPYELEPLIFQVPFPL